ncbi:MAG: acyl-ACP--UDP-N-acetylglucosamine O-acyltransferase [Candidatus Omnitrophica bacterium]|nr:acyl-ACP--UDP-N-acetylglucosamine O-acyltransferase [Candidatus Omnitrophota bacterium]
MNKIHPTAIIDRKAKLGADTEIGPYVIVEAEVQIGHNVKISAHAQILRATSIGDDCQIHTGSIIGGWPQIRGQAMNTVGNLTIGKRNVLREYVTVHRSKFAGKSTLIGDDNYFMAFSHIAHDSTIANQVTICNGALIAGHVTVEDYAFISGNVTVHQFCRIGKLSMVGGLSRVAKDVPPYMLVKGDSAVWAVNSVGLRRANVSIQARREIKQAFRLLYKSGLNVQQALSELQNKTDSAEIKYLINFIEHSQRGICAYKSPSLRERIFLSAPIINLIQIPAYRLFQENRKQQKALV